MNKPMIESQLGFRSDEIMVNNHPTWWEGIITHKKNMREQSQLLFSSPFTIDTSIFPIAKLEKMTNLFGGL